MFKRAFKDVPNVYTQHVPYLTNVIDQLKKNQLKESEYPFINSPGQYFRTSEILIFQLGGTTYEEAKEVGLKN